MELREHLSTTASLLAIATVIVGVSYYSFSMHLSIKTLKQDNSELSKQVKVLKSGIEEGNLKLFQELALLKSTVLGFSKKQNTTLNSIPGPKGEKGDEGPQGVRGSAGKSVSQSEVKKIVSKELSILLAQKNHKVSANLYISNAKNMETVKINEGSSLALLEGVITVSVSDSSTGKCLYRVTSVHKEGKISYADVGARTGLNEHGIPGLYLLLTGGNYNPGYCTFKFI